MRRCLAAILGVAAAMALVACGGGHGNSSGTSAAGSSSHSDATNTTVPNTPTDPAAQQLQSLSQEFGSASFEVHYAINDSGSDQPLNGFITIYTKGTDRTRFDVASNESGQTVSLILLQTPDNSVFCLPDAGALAQLGTTQRPIAVMFMPESSA